MIDIGKKILPLPDALRASLADTGTSKYARMEIALKAFEEGYAHGEMMKAMGVSQTDYYRYVRLIRSGNQDAITLYKTGAIGLRQALQMSKGDAPIGNLYMYDLQDKGAEVLCANKHQCLYVCDGRCYFAARRKAVYEIDNADYAINVLRDVISSGCVITAGLDIFRDGKRIGNLKSRLVSAYANIPLDKIRQVRLRHRGDSAYDLRISNLCCLTLGATIPSLSNTVVEHRGKDIVITCKSSGIVAYVDYSPAMMRILTECGTLHSKARDNRLSLFICGRNDKFIHHIRVALDLYGLPDGFGRDDVVTMVERLQAEYLSKNVTVDHIDGDCFNNRLSNLIPMSRQDNVRKQSLTSTLVNLDANNGDIVHWFCWSERFNDVSIRMRAGYCSPLQAPVYLVEGVYSVPEYLNEMKRFNEIASDRKHLQSLLDPDEGGEMTHDYSVF